MTSEREVATGLADALQRESWAVEAEPQRLPGSRYDIVATAPTGRQFLIEVKTGRGSTHFATLAQVERYANELGSLRDQDVLPVLVTTQHISPTLEAVAARVGVFVVALPAEEGEDTTSLYQGALARLRELASSK